MLTTKRLYSNNYGTTIQNPTTKGAARNYNPTITNADNNNNDDGDGDEYQQRQFKLFSRNRILTAFLGLIALKIAQKLLVGALNLMPSWVDIFEEHSLDNELNIEESEKSLLLLKNDSNKVLIQVKFLEVYSLALWDSFIVMINKIYDTDNNRDSVSTMMFTPSQYGIIIDSDMAKNFEMRVNEYLKNNNNNNNNKNNSQIDLETVKWECETFTNKDAIKFVEKRKNIFSRECDCKLHKEYDTYMRSMMILQNPQHFRAAVSLQLVNNNNKNNNHFTNGDNSAIDNFYNNGLHNKEKMIKCVKDISNTTFNFIYDKNDLENDENIHNLNAKSLDWSAVHRINGTNDELILFIFHSNHGDNLNNDRDKILSEWKMIINECIKLQQNLEKNNTGDSDSNSNNNCCNVTMSIMPGIPWLDEETKEFTKRVNNKLAVTQNQRLNGKEFEFDPFCEHYIVSSWRAANLIASMAVAKSKQNENENESGGNVFFLGENISNMDSDETDAVIEETFRIYKGLLDEQNDELVLTVLDAMEQVEIDQLG